MKTTALVSACLGVIVALAEIALGITDSLQNIPRWLDAVLLCAWPTQLFLGGHLPADRGPQIGSVLVLFLVAIGANALLYLCVGCVCAGVYRFARRFFTQPRATI